MPDALEQAKKSLGASFGDYSQEINAQRAQAAALIAIAERMDGQQSHMLPQIQTLAIEALGTDGGHHKQWYLEKILALIAKADTFEVCKAAYEWESGIAP